MEVDVAPTHILKYVFSLTENTDDRRNTKTREIYVARHTREVRVRPSTRFARTYTQKNKTACVQRPPNVRIRVIRYTAYGRTTHVVS